ncbi:MAG: Mo-dependent nitrogenase C-terminal domain-containing protein [Cyanobacteriota bacterium]|nr:Mo-dependent nitrogenase C-terminal domain-containing protein [Cyanobacteriota bacterium]
MMPTATLKPASASRKALYLWRIPLKTLQQWLDHIEIRDPRIAHWICQVLPAQCPFERDIVLSGHKLFHIPAMCQINPVYDQLMGIRFRALSYLAEQGEDITPYIS